LQAIATARRLGARVEAFDTRPVVEEQVRSLGAKFVKIDIGEVGQTAQGYAKELTPEQVAKQREGMAKVCAASDIVITTAKVFGRKAPILLTRGMISGMRPEASSSISPRKAAAMSRAPFPTRKSSPRTASASSVGTRSKCRVPRHASQMFAANMVNLIEHFWDAENKTFPIKTEDEIIGGCMLTHDGRVVHERFTNP
jgi:H+-translocating NAD(P) transhydrogenase subunit alpha